VKLVIFCEAAADFRTASALVDRVLHEHGPEWLRDLLASHAESIREWTSDGQGRTYFDLHKLDAYRRDLEGLRFRQGHFDGKPGEADAQSARNAFTIARELHKRNPSLGLSAVLFVRDMDAQGESRRQGLEQARSEAASLMSLPIVLGCADPMREAWVLAGFDPESDEEKSLLDELRRDLGFSPCEEAHRLTAVNEQAKGSPKRVIRELTGNALAREERCWNEAPLERLIARGDKSGLRAFLAEVKEHIVPLSTAAPARE
jgi:hypothetical protein